MTKRMMMPTKVKLIVSMAMVIMVIRGGDSEHQVHFQ